VSKRFHDTELWQKSWFLELPPIYKIAYYYLISHCDNAGLIVPNMRMLNFVCGTKITQAQLLEHLGNHIMQIDGTSKWYLHKFNAFQYGELRDNNNAHMSVIKKLEKYNIPDSLQPLTSTSPAPKSTSIVKSNDCNDEGFEAWYDLYAKKVDYSIAKKRWQKVNKSLIPQIMEHTAKYVVSKPDKQFRKDPSAYLNQKHWENEVIDPDASFEEPENATVEKWRYSK